MVKYMHTVPNSNFISILLDDLYQKINYASKEIRVYDLKTKPLFKGDATVIIFLFWDRHFTLPNLLANDWKKMIMNSFPTNYL